MEASLRFDAIHYSDVNRYLSQYPDCVPSSLSSTLNELRYNTIPQTLAQRKSDAEPFLEKSEIVSLVDWKLKHGKYRPNLAKLVASNTVADVRETTKEAFNVYDDGAHYDKAVSRIAKLKGVGPATASLLLSCYDPARVPFFSDELFRYLHWEDTESGGWDRKIGYTMKEYKEMYARMQKMRERLEKESGKTVSAVEVEKMAYALAKEAQNGAIVCTTIEEPKEQVEDNKATEAPNPKKRKRTKIPELP